MRRLFFHAAAATGHPGVVEALQDQAQATLRPFHRYLSQAIHTARERQIRYQLRWERVRDVRTFALRAVDTLLRAPRRRPGYLVQSWPAGVEPDLAQHAFVIARGLPVQVVSAVRTAGGLRIATEPALEPADRLLWCRVDCEIAAEPPPAPPRQVTDLEGRRLELRGTPAPDGDGDWRLVVVGERRDAELIVDGERVEVEVVPAMDGLRRVQDGAGVWLEVSGGSLRVEGLPAEGLLHGDNGVCFEWSAGSRRQRGHWVQLLSPERISADEALDPRAAFCEGDVAEVLTAKSRRDGEVYKVLRIDQDRYQLLLDRLPPEGSTLFLPVDLRNLYLQQRALRQLADAPLPHHQGLLRLCEDPARVRWPAVSPQEPARWRSLTDETRSGTLEQRDFVARALGTPDLAFLEGPPGSGKTTAICEIVQQLVARGERVLLCASTHVAIDNVLERLLAADLPIDAVRIGKLDRVDDRVRATQLDARIDALLERWQTVPELRCLGDGELRAMAERTVVMAASLTCGTTMGIVSHPLFRGRDEDLRAAERPIATLPHWDVLIVDEASKTLIQEFLVPALMARRWIVVGDVRQLPPFADRDEIVANLRDLVDEEDREIFPREHQRACLLRFRLLREEVRQPGMRWLIVERPAVLDWIARELEAEPAAARDVLRVVTRGVAPAGRVRSVSLEQLRAGAPEALHLAAADWVLIGDDLIGEVAPLLPCDLLLARTEADRIEGLSERDPLRFRQAWWLARAGALPKPYKERGSRRDAIASFGDAERHEADWLARHDLAQELAWRLTRLHELRRSRGDRQRERLRADLRALAPRAPRIDKPIAELEDIGLPSILEVLQEGVGRERSRRRSALTEGLAGSGGRAFEARFERLSYQHRMHPDISRFPREVFYDRASLLDANTIEQRDARLGWSFGDLRARSAWAHVAGRERDGVNADEVRVIAGIARDFIAWARAAGPPSGRMPEAIWEVACLCFYAKQERALSQMLRELTGWDGHTRFRAAGAPVELVCGTVDRFQGREADLVMLSMRNTHRVGFLDSPNRLNVAVTRARQQLVVVGDGIYFGQCRIDELQRLALETARVDEARVARWQEGGR